MRNWIDLLFRLTGLLFLVHQRTPLASCFSPAHTWNHNRITCTDGFTSCRTLLSMFVNEQPTTAPATNERVHKEKPIPSVSPHVDRNNQVFKVGDTVRIIVSNIRAHHISAKGFGTFSQSMTFLPAPENATRKDKCLLLPMGLIGTLVTVYDAGDSDSSLPLQVKFTPGDSGAYDVPVAFTMHLDTSEVEVCC